MSQAQIHIQMAIYCITGDMYYSHFSEQTTQDGTTAHNMYRSGAVILLAKPAVFIMTKHGFTDRPFHYVSDWFA